MVNLSIIKKLKKIESIKNKQAKNNEKIELTAMKILSQHKYAFKVLAE